LSQQPETEYFKDGYFFKAEFLQWHESQKYPFCRLKAITIDKDEVSEETKDPYPFHISDLDLAKRMIMEDRGCKTGYQTKLNAEKLNEEKKMIEKRHSKSLAEKDRADLQGLTTYTIDGKKTRCRDDAISWLVDGDVQKLFVHITDISDILPAGSKIEAEAKEKLMSTYIGDFIRPMLPGFLSY
jgi:exoribonuclease R